MSAAGKLGPYPARAEGWLLWERETPGGACGNQCKMCEVRHNIYNVDTTTVRLILLQLLFTIIIIVNDNYNNFL